MKICEVFDCNKPTKARDLCPAHYSQLRRTGSPTGSLKKPETINPEGFMAQQPVLYCLVKGCDNPHLCKGYCSMHYQRWINNGDPLISKAPTGKPEDPCSKCKINSRRSSPTTGKVHSWCQPCMNEASRKWNASEAGPRWRRYKLKKQDIINMKAAQGNVCAICEDSFNNVEDHVDHDNRCCGKERVQNGGTCGKCIRALLCGSCNQGLGNFKDSSERLEQAINYLRKWE